MGPVDSSIGTFRKYHVPPVKVTANVYFVTKETGEALTWRDAGWRHGALLKVPISHSTTWFGESFSVKPCTHVISRVKLCKTPRIHGVDMKLTSCLVSLISVVVVAAAAAGLSVFVT